MGLDFIKGQWIENWVVKFWSTIWWSGTIKIFKWLKILGETNDNEGLERRPGALYLVMELRHPLMFRNWSVGSRKETALLVPELVTAPVRAGQALEETTALMWVLARVTRVEAVTAWNWRVRDLDCVTASQLEASGVSTSASGEWWEL